MDYELAKELQKAKFPKSKDWVEHSTLMKGNYFMVDGYGVPNLSELIEACGETRIAPNLNTKEQKPIKHLFRLGVGDEWFAEYEFYESSILNNITGLPVIGFGKTPEEAVAKLWLELNKVDTNKNT